MTLVAKLQDVDQQLLRATQVVQIHVRLADSLVSSQTPPGLDQKGEMEILGLIDSVERAQRGLQNITTQLLVLAKCCVRQTALEKENEEVNETGDDEVKNDVKNEFLVEEHYETIEENTLDSPQMLNLQTEERSSLEKYTAMAKNAVKMVIDPEDAETIEVWRRIVEVNGLNANREFLDLLSEGEVEKEVAESFLNATTFAVSVLTSYQAKSQKPLWLMQLVEDLTDVENGAKTSKFAKVLAPLEKCRDDLVAYCSRNDRDTLEDMSNYVVLIERHRGVQANQLLPYLLTLLRKFTCDCTDYQLRQDVGGEAPRTDSKWVHFNEVGIALANWMQLLWVSDVKCSKVDGVLVSSYFRQFETRFPGRLPATLHENWCQMIGDRVIRIIDDDNAKEESMSQKNSHDHLHGGETTSNSTPIGESVPQADRLKPLHSDETRNDSAATTLPNAEVMIYVNHGLDPPKPLDHYVSVAKEGKCEVENAVRDHTSSCALKKQPEVVIGKWSVILKSSFEWAHIDFCARVSKGDMDTQTVIAFCEATKFTMSLMTTYESRHFSRVWIMHTIMILDATTKGILMSECSQALQPLLQIRDELIQYCDKRFPDIFDGVSECVKNIEQVV